MGAVRRQRGRKGAGREEVGREQAQQEVKWVVLHAFALGSCGWSHTPLFLCPSLVDLCESSCMPLLLDLDFCVLRSSLVYLVLLSICFLSLGLHFLVSSSFLLLLFSAVIRRALLS